MDLFTDDDDDGELGSLSSLTSLSSSSHSSDSPPPAEPSPKKRQRRSRVYVSVPPLHYRVVAAASSASDPARQKVSQPAPPPQPSQLTTTTDKPRIPTISSESESPIKAPAPAPPTAPSTTDVLKHLHFTKTNSKPKRSSPPSTLPGHPSPRHQHQHEEHDSDAFAQQLAHLINLATRASTRSSSAPLPPPHPESPSVPQSDTGTLASSEQDSSSQHSVPPDLIVEIIRQTVKVTVKEFARCLVVCPSCQQQFTPSNPSETSHPLQTNQRQQPEPDGNSHNAPHHTTSAENGYRHHALNNVVKRHTKPDRRPQQQRYYTQGSCPPEYPPSPRHHDGWSGSRRREDTTAEHPHPVSSAGEPYQNIGKRKWSAFCQDHANAREEPSPSRRQRQDKPEDVTDLSDSGAVDRSAGWGYASNTPLVDQVTERVLARSSKGLNASRGYARRWDERPHYHLRNHHRPPHHPHLNPNHRPESEYHHHHHYNHRDSPRPRSPSPAHSGTFLDRNSNSEEGGRLMHASPSPGWRTGYTYMALSPARSRSRSPPQPPPQPRISPPPLPRYPPLTPPPASAPPTPSKTTPLRPYSSGGKARTRTEEGRKDWCQGIPRGGS